MTTQVQLAECKHFVGWEVIALGRAASGEQFDRGSIHSLWEIERNEQLLHREYFRLDEAEADFRKAAWGLNGCSTLGSMFVCGCPEDDSFEEKKHALRAQLQTLLQQQGEAHQASVEMTQKGELLIVRYLGPSGQTCRRLLNIARHEVLSSLGITGDDARIWNT
jgi:urease accessory protein